MNTWAYILAFIVLIYIGICFFFYFYQESFLFHPRVTAKDFVYEFNYPYEEHWFETPNEGRIHALKFNAEDSKGVVFYLHGNAGSLRDWGWVYPEFVSRGYDLLLIDYRAYGKSTGELSETNMITDAAFVYNQLMQDYDQNQIIVYGRSIGTGVAVQLAAQKEPKALVLESPYYSIQDIAKKMAPIFPLNLLLRYKFESFKFINQVTCPKYIIHGEQDHVVPFASGSKLAKVATQGLTMIPVEDAQHNDIANFAEFGKMLDEALK